MSPLLFIIGTEYFSRILRMASTDLGFSFHPQSKTIKLRHLCFDDDLLLICKGNAYSIRILRQGLDLFSNSSCIIANFSSLLCIW